MQTLSHPALPSATGPAIPLPARSTRAAKRPFRAAMRAFALMASLALGTMGTARAANFVVQTGADNSGAGTLRDAITKANAQSSDDTITFAFGTTITLSSPLPVIAGNGTLSIAAPGVGVIISGNNTFRVFEVGSGANVTLTGLTIRRGRPSADSFGVGGGIFNLGTLLVDSCTLTGNSATYGGAIHSETNLSGVTLTIRNSTLSGNTATDAGGGSAGGAIDNQVGLTVIESSTISGNSAPAGSGGGVSSTGDTLTRTVVHNSIISGNTGGDVELVFGTTNSFQSGGYNFIGTGSGTAPFTSTADVRNNTNPGLVGLASNGGGTQTMALLATSPARDAGDADPPVDQRGVLRPVGSKDDKGAFEYQPPDPTGAAALVVTTTTDVTDIDGLISLREAITTANGDGVNSAITFDGAAFAAPRKTITLTSVLPDLTGNGTLSITAPAAGVIVSGNNARRVLQVASNANVTLTGLTISGGNAGSSNGGGGVNNLGGTLLLDSCTLSGNSAGVGGAIQSATKVTGGVTTLRNCTLSGNTATGTSSVGGAIYNIDGLVEIESTSISGNSAPANSGGGVASGSFSTRTSVHNSIIAGNTGGDVVFVFGNGANTFESTGYNLIGVGNATTVFNVTGDVRDNTNPGLSALAENGGPTQTRAITTSSPAFNAGDTALSFDQRGVARPQVGVDDKGAFELVLDPTGAEGLIVTTNADVSTVDGFISLREAIGNANSNADSSTITFDASVRGVVDLASALPPITTPTTVRGPGANLLSINRSGTASAFRLFTFNAGASRIQELTLSGGLATGTGDGGLDGTGGAVLVRQGVVLSLNSVHVLNNTALGGGGVENFGTLNVGDSTFSNNTATQGTGGAIHSTPVATSFSVSSSTFVGNRSADSGGAIRADTAGTLNSLTVAGNFADTDRNDTGVGGGLSLAGGTLINSLVVGNIAGANTSSNVAGTASTTSFNRITGTAVAAGLETDGAGAPLLKNNGGRTPTVALLAGSPAISAGSTTLNFDQRGVARPQGANDDIGAFEFNTPLVISVTRLDQNPATVSSVRFRVEFSVSVLGVGAEDFALATTGGISGASVTGVTGNGAVYTVTVGNISGTGTLRLDLRASGTGITDTAGNAIVGGFTLGETYTRNGPSGASDTTGVIISEFRFRGKSGALDEYVELYNKRGGPLNISGWSIQTRTASGLQTTLVPDGKIIPPFGRYLFTGSGFSLSGYGTSDQPIAADILDASGVALFNAAGTAQDAVGFTTSDAALREGAGLPSAPTSDGEYAFVRDTTGTLPKDTADSTNDFVFVIADADATTPTALATVSGTSGNVMGRLGAPSPEGIADPAYANPIISGALLDPNVSQSAAPNRERVGFVPNTSLGDLLIRRTITNNSGRPITKLRFSVASITSLGTPGPASQADVRLVSSTDENVTIGMTSVPVKGLTLETGAAGQPALPLGGGLGSSAVLGEVSMATPLANGASRSVVFRLQILKSGNFSVLFNFHAAPGS